MKVKQKKKNNSADRMSGIWRLAGSEAWDHMD